MTYKLFDTKLDEHRAAGRLVPFVPVLDADESIKRDLFMPPALLITLQQNNPKKAMNYVANIRAFLGRYVKGHQVDNHDYIKSWKDDIFELRVQNQRRKERLRIFGAFGRPDTLVIFFRKYRHEFGDIDDPKWDEAIQRAIDAWNSYFPGIRRMSARPFSNCVTFNAFDVFA